MISSLQVANQSLFLWLNQVCGALPDWFWASWTITGHTSMVFALLAPLLLPPLQLPRWCRPASSQLGGSVVITALFICSVLGGIAATVLKESFQIPRPPAVLAADSFRLIGHKLELVSFPSGHTLTAFAVATLLIMGLRLSGWRMWLLATAACLVGLSRIAVGAHWPLDVLFGALAGSLCAYLSLIAAKYAHVRFLSLTKQRHILIQTLVLLAVSSSLFWTSMGYPDAIVWQHGVTLFGVIICLYALYSHLLTLKFDKSFNQHKRT